MSTVIVEQRLPVIIQFISIIPAYTQYIASVTAIFIFWLCPSLAPQMPVREILSKPRRTISIHSLKSTTSTLVDTASANDGASKASGDLNGDFNNSPTKFTNPFSKLSSPMKMGKSPTLSLRPFARRMSMPARRLSEHITTALASPFQTPYTPDLEEADSYFAPQGRLHAHHCMSMVEVKETETEDLKEAALVEVEVVKVERVDRMARVECWVAEQAECVVEAPIVAPMTPSAPLKVPKGWNCVTKKAKKVLLRGRRPTL
ncbi:hypothetical protein D9615_006000 [Tricholomella constricta]|uniref:Uncharacterized protein n=1 Tax=Tricholomella constricta TaxID=117010 RepID=A0A8H5M388_9AGAR|nr:hypothetical protein D9615_006000 [Tricholomella constricta]